MSAAFLRLPGQGRDLFRTTGGRLACHGANVYAASLGKSVKKRCNANVREGACRVVHFPCVSVPSFCSS